MKLFCFMKFNELMVFTRAPFCRLCGLVLREASKNKPFDRLGMGIPLSEQGNPIHKNHPVVRRGHPGDCILEITEQVIADQTADRVGDAAATGHETAARLLVNRRRAAEGDVVQ